MPRELTESGGEISFTETVSDANGHNILIESVEFSKINGTSNSDGFRPTWLSWTSNQTIKSDGSTERGVNVTIQTSGISAGNTYTFEFVASDGIENTAHTVDLVVGGPTPFNLSSLTFTGSTFDFTNETGSPGGMFWGDSGNKLYILSTFEEIYQYNTPVPYSLPDLSYSGNSFDVSSEESICTDFVWGDGGSKLYICGFTDIVHQYGASNPWDVSALTYNGNNFDHSLRMDAAGAITFRNDGTSFFLSDSNTDLIHKWTLSTPWDLGTTSYFSSQIDVDNEASGVDDIIFSNSGDKFFTIDPNSDKIHEYNLSIPFNTSSASYSGNFFDLVSINDGPGGFDFSNDGTKLFVIGEDNGGETLVYEFDVI